MEDLENKLRRFSSSRYFQVIEKLRDLPRGSIKKRIISGQTYYYLQRREGKKVIHEYLGKTVPKKLLKQFDKKKALETILKEINNS